MTLLERIQQDGLRRKGTPKSGFRYLTADGKAVTREQRERVEALKLPPAWTDVFIHPNPNAHLQAVGKDKAGRWQYRYHARFRQRQEAKKFDRLIGFAESLPAMRARVERDLRRRDLGRERVLAGILQILSTCFIRPGSQVYADENGSYGLATLRPRHVKVKGDCVHFSFPGKSGKQQERTLRDRRVANLVRQLLKVPGKEVFKYLDEDGRPIDVRRRDINVYIKEVMGERFTAKDFRTWAGTLVAACALARAGAEWEAHPQTAAAVAAKAQARARKKQVVAAVKEAAELLGNTPAICRASYIYPSVLSSFDRGVVVQRHFQSVEELVTHRRPGLHPSERALLRLLKAQGRPRASASARGRTKAAAGQRPAGPARSRSSVPSPRASPRRPRALRPRTG